MGMLEDEGGRGHPVDLRLAAGLGGCDRRAVPRSGHHERVQEPVEELARDADGWVTTKTRCVVVGTLLRGGAIGSSAVVVVTELL